MKTPLRQIDFSARKGNIVHIEYSNSPDYTQFNKTLVWDQKVEKGGPLKVFKKFRKWKF